MSFDLIAWVVGTGVTVLGLLLVVVQYHYKQSNEFMTVKYAALDKKMDELEKENKLLRNDMNNDFVRLEQFSNTVNNFREDMGKVFDQLGTVSKGLHELIGALKERNKNVS